MNTLGRTKSTGQFVINDVQLDRLANILRGKLFRHAPDALLIIDEADNIVMVNARAEEMFRFRQLQSGKLNINALFPDWNQMVKPHFENGSEHNYQCTLRAFKNEKEEFSVDLSLSSVALGTQTMSIASVRTTIAPDAGRYVLETTYQELRRDKEHLETLVKTDALTDLLNRRGLENVLSREIEFARRNKTELMAVLIDLDDFKKVNDSKGHFAGDLVLKHVARILRKSVRAIDWLGRVGGDEFLVLLPGASLKSGAQIAERIRLELSECSLAWADGDIRQTASLALVALPLTVCSIEEILELTKDALKDSKRRGKNCVSTGSSESNDQVDTKKSNVRAVLEHHSFNSVAQAIVRLATNEIVGYELLTRGPSDELARPDELFRVSSENQLLTNVDLRCLKSCVNHSTTMPSGGTYHVNLFPSTLLEVPAAKLIEQFQNAGEGKKFCVELSVKQIKSDPTYLIEPVRALKEHEILIALDDVGFGYTSLESFFMLTPDIVKFDGELVYGISTDRNKQQLVQNLIKAADIIGATTIAECVEQEGDFLMLRDLGIQFGQGWYLDHPVKHSS